MTVRIEVDRGNGVLLLALDDRRAALTVTEAAALVALIEGGVDLLAAPGGQGDGWLHSGT
jgi:hypothetical protein